VLLGRSANASSPVLQLIASEFPYLIRVKIQHSSLPGSQATSRQCDHQSSRQMLANLDQGCFWRASGRPQLLPPSVRARNDDLDFIHNLVCAVLPAPQGLTLRHPYTCRAHYRDRRHLNQLPSFECRDVY
jgi:hypothetical protein